MGSLELYEPINILKPVAENIWIVDGPIVNMSVVLGLTIPFTTRMTVVRLENGDLFLHSPIRWSQSLAEGLESLGKIRHLISPNKIHYEYIREWKSRYPDSVAWASPGVRERAAGQKIQVDFDRDLEDSPPPEWAHEIDQVVVHGSRALTEVVFYHRPSRTAILTDLIENFELRKIKNVFFKWLIKLAGSAHPDGKAPKDMRLTFRGHKKEAAEAVRKILEWEPERAILAHGKWYSENGAAELRRAFRWLKPYV